MCTCVCERGSVLEGSRKGVLGKGAREGMRSLSDAGGKRAREGGHMFANVSAGADTKANALRAGGTHELLQYAILLNAARDDDGGRDAGKEFDLLGRLRALELVDLKRATIDTAKGEVCRVTQKRTLGGRFEVTAHFRLVI